MADVNAVINGIDEGETVEFVRDMANIPSFSGDERPCAEFVALRLKHWGFDQVVVQEAEPGRPNVIGILKGSGEGPSFMMNGHLDIDPVPVDWKWPLWRTAIADGNMYGWGIQNMKGGIGAMIMAALAVKRSGIALKGDLMVSCVVGELQGGVGTVHMIKEGFVPDLAIVPEPTNCSIRTIHAGCLVFLMHTYGRSTWVGKQHKEPHVNAVYKMKKAMAALKGIQWRVRPHPDLPTLPLMAVGAMIGGYTKEYYLKRPALHADVCTAAVDIRLTPYMTVEEVMAQVGEVLDQVKADDPDFRYELELPPAPYRAPWHAVKHYWPPMEIAKDHPLVQLTAQKHLQVTGESPAIGPHIPGSRAGADSGHLMAAGTPCFNYGPTMHSGFTDGLPITNLVTATKVLSLVAADVCSRRKGDI